MSRSHGLVFYNATSSPPEIGGAGAIRKIAAEGVFGTALFLGLVCNVNGQSLQLHDLPLNSVVQIGSYDYIKIAENKYMQSSEVVCPDGATVGGKYVKCFADEEEYDKKCKTCEFDCQIYVYAGNTEMYAMCMGIVGSSINYAYTGEIQTFIAPISGTYKLEVWGAQGGTNTGVGGKGGYSYGRVSLLANQTIYVVVGGQGQPASTSGQSNTAGYNGGGTGGSSGPSVSTYNGSGGGGATHMATETGLLSELALNTDSVKIVAGGGGGGHYATSGCGPGNHTGGYGGGANGGSGNGYSTASGATQTSGNAFGKGGDYGSNAGSGGGGGWYGGYACHCCSGSGGSGYIGGVTDGESTGNIREGNGYARITLISVN